MQLPTAQLIEILTEAGIRPSAQRLSVLEYLTGTTCHPSADRIYEDVHAMQPTLSRSTIYNTVKLFLDKGVIETVAGDSSECRYDYFTSRTRIFSADNAEKCTISHSTWTPSAIPVASTLNTLYWCSPGYAPIAAPAGRKKAKPHTTHSIITYSIYTPYTSYNYERP